MFHCSPLQIILTIASTWVLDILKAQCRNWLLAMWHAACAVLSSQTFQRCCATEEQKERGSINLFSSVYTLHWWSKVPWSLNDMQLRETELYSCRLLRFHVKKSDFAMWMATRSVLRHFEHQGCCPAGQLYLWVGRCWQLYLTMGFLYSFVLFTKTAQDSSLDNSYSPFPWHFHAQAAFIGTLCLGPLLGIGVAVLLHGYAFDTHQKCSETHSNIVKLLQRHDMWLNTSVCWCLARFEICKMFDLLGFVWIRAGTIAVALSWVVLHGKK